MVNQAVFLIIFFSFIILSVTFVSMQVQGTFKKIKEKILKLFK